MKSIILIACMLAVALCAPLDKYMEFDIRHAPAEAAKVIPAGALPGSLDVLLPVDEQNHIVVGPVRGFIKQEIPNPNGRESKDVYIAFGFEPDVAASPVVPAVPVAPVAPVAPVVPAVPVAPVAPAAPAAPAAPVAPAVSVVAAQAPAARPTGDDDDDDDD